jgi:hypothetical protein
MAHAVLITFAASSAPEGQLADAQLAELARRQTAAADGHATATTWLRHDATLGSFSVFASAEAVDAYLASDDLADLLLHPAFVEFKVERFSVVTGPPAEQEGGHSRRSP